MAKKKKYDVSVDDFVNMAHEYGVEDNTLFLSAINTYDLQLKVIKSIKDEIEEGDATVEKEYVKGRKNLYINPCVKELPKHADSANKTAALILNIIKDLGRRKSVSGDDFDNF